MTLRRPFRTLDKTFTEFIAALFKLKAYSVLSMTGKLTFYAQKL